MLAKCCVIFAPEVLHTSMQTMFSQGITAALVVWVSSLLYLCAFYYTELSCVQLMRPLGMLGTNTRL